MMSLMLAVLLQAAEIEPVRRELGPFALVFMLFSMGAVTLLAGWCFTKILSGRAHFDPDGTGPARSPVRGEAEGPPRRGR